MRSSLLASLLGTLALSGRLPAQVDWAWIGGGGPTTLRRGYSVTYDPDRAALLLYGGYEQWGFGFIYTDLWQWRAGVWQQLLGRIGPISGAGIGMAYDAHRARIVLFGGFTGYPGFGVFDRTAEGDGSAWVVATPAHHPAARFGHGLVYDAARRKTVLYGGRSLEEMFADTWEWDGNDWTEVSTVHQPPPGSTALAYDAVRARVVQASFDAANNRFTTFEYDGSDWCERTPAVAPAVSVTALAYDGARRRTVLVGGGETWEWDGDVWQRRSPATPPPPANGFALVFEAAAGRTLLIGGERSSPPGPFDEIWSYAPIWPATAAAFGTGCAGGASVPQLAPLSLPWLGDTLTLRVGDLLPSAAPCLLLGASDQLWGSVPLPLDLAPFGMPGCALRVSPDLLLPLAATAGHADLALLVPNDRELLGGRLHAQAAAVEAAATPTVAWTAGLTLVVGAR